MEVEQKVNRSLSQVEYIHVLKWEANPNNINIFKYRIYIIKNSSLNSDLGLFANRVSKIRTNNRSILSGETRNLLAEMNGDTFSYIHRGVEKETSFFYGLVAVNDEAREGSPAYGIVS